jgi:hypothetical protein
VGLQPALLHMEDISDKTKSVVSLNNANNYYNIYSYIYRFQIRVILLLFRLGGRLLMANSRSINNTIYNVVILGCFYVIGVAFSWIRSFIDNELAYNVKKFGLFTAFLLVTWIHVTFR